MKELLDTLATWEADGTTGATIGRAVVVRTFGSAPRPEGAVLLYATDGRIAGSVSGGCVEGAAAEEIEHARATGNARVIRYGISDEQAWDVGLACGGTIDVLVEPVAPAVVIEAARGSVGAGGHGSAVITPLPADSPPGEFGPHEPGEGAPPAAELIVTDDGRLTGTLGSRSWTPSWSRRPGCPAPWTVADRRARRPLVVRRGLPGPPAAGRGRGRRGRPVARPARARARVRDGRGRRPNLIRDRRALPRGGPVDHRLARRGRRGDRARPERRGGRPVARRQVR